MHRTAVMLLEHKKLQMTGNRPRSEWFTIADFLLTESRFHFQFINTLWVGEMLSPSKYLSLSSSYADDAHDNSQIFCAWK